MTAAAVPESYRYPGEYRSEVGMDKKSHGDLSLLVAKKRMLLDVLRYIPESTNGWNLEVMMELRSGGHPIRER